MHSMINWFARNGVAANLLMAGIIFWGLHALNNRIPLEVFPSFELDVVNVRVPYRGASPTEIEESITIKVEEAIQDIAGIKSLTSTAAEDLGTVRININSDADIDKILEDVQQRVDQINTFPADADEPSIYVPERKREVISVIIAGDLSEKELRQLGNQVRDDLEQLPNVSQVSLSGVRDFELAIEISEQTLREYGLTFAKVASAIRQSSIDMSAGAIRTAGGEVLIRTNGQHYSKEDFSDTLIMSSEDGTRVTLADIARLSDGFEENPLEQSYNSRNSIEIDIYRSGNQSAITVADEVKNYLPIAQAAMPENVTLGYWRDRSRIVKARLSTLNKSAMQGGLLVIVLLALFLRSWVAFWVFIGVPVSFMGGLALMPEIGVTINLISLFAFILVLGIVVDDAIVTGENIYTHMRRNPNALEAAIAGTQEVAIPVTFGILTTVAAFTPLLMIEGMRGKIFAQIPMIVIPVLLFSLIESKLVLPAHMKHLNFHKKTRPNLFARLQHKIADALEWAIRHWYQPALAACLRQRYLTLSVFVGTAIIVFSLVSSGHVRFIFFPRIQSEIANASLTMPAGTPFEVTQKHIQKINDAAVALQQKYIDPTTDASIIEGIMSVAGSQGGSGGQSHLGRVMFEITPPEERTLNVSSSQLVGEWRRAIGDIPGAREINYRAEIGRGGSPINVQLSGRDFEQLRLLASEVKGRLATYPGVNDITDSFADGKQEIKLNIKPAAQQLGLTLLDLAEQVRQAFFGFEVQTIQRDRDEVRVVVRYPESERQSLDSLQTMRIRTPANIDVPFSEVAEATWGRGFATIKRVDRRRTINIEADADKETADIESIKQELNTDLTALLQGYPGVSYSLEGEAREQRDSFGSLRTGILIVLGAIYALLAVPLRSYSQPIMVMLVIPFGVVGAILGHIVMNMNLSIMSYMGMLALAGVVINDSLVLVDYINKRRGAGLQVFESVKAAGVARFRAILLTSLTTFFGLMPLIFEESTQAQFLIPMAVSLGFGILFTTLVTLLLIPINYLILEDLKNLFRPEKSTTNSDTENVAAQGLQQ
ncbi:acriflavine resistance protein B [Chromatiales bacterium (ex Bugula neritina AB1)]|nr:acriflavine resistance protein B [Chromatiales bacterium (ex Bugula neritina AB1)]